MLLTIDDRLVVLEREVGSAQLLRRSSGLEVVGVGAGRAGPVDGLDRLGRDARDVGAVPALRSTLLLEPARAALGLALLGTLPITRHGSARLLVRRVLACTSGSICEAQPDPGCCASTSRFGSSAACTPRMRGSRRFERLRVPWVLRKVVREATGGTQTSRGRPRGRACSLAARIALRQRRQIMRHSHLHGCARSPHHGRQHDLHARPRRDPARVRPNRGRRRVRRHRGAAHDLPTTTSRCARTRGRDLLGRRRAARRCFAGRRRSASSSSTSIESGFKPQLRAKTFDVAGDSVIVRGSIRLTRPDGSFAETKVSWTYHFRDGLVDDIGWEPRAGE